MGLGVNFELTNLTSDYLAMSTTSRPPTPVSQLQAVKISRYDYPEAERIAYTWERVAREKEGEARRDTEKAQFRACANISNAVSNAVASCFEHSNYNRYIYTCKDSEGNDQGMMVINIEIDRVYVALLVTNPINIRSDVNANEIKKVNGAGTCLLNKAVEIATQEGKESVWLTPLQSAVGFYKRHGFVFDGWSMKKTIQKIEDVSPFYFNVA